MYQAPFFLKTELQSREGIYIIYIHMKEQISSPQESPRHRRRCTAAANLAMGANVICTHEWITYILDLNFGSNINIKTNTVVPLSSLPPLSSA